MKRLAVPRPRPTRKAEMAVAAGQCLTGASLREYWNGLDGIEQMAVRDVVYGHEQGIDWNQFGAKLGALPAGLAEGLRSLPLPLRFSSFAWETVTGATRLSFCRSRGGGTAPAGVRPAASRGCARRCGRIAGGSGTVTFRRKRRRR